MNNLIIVETPTSKVIRAFDGLSRLIQENVEYDGVTEPKQFTIEEDTLIKEFDLNYLYTIEKTIIDIIDRLDSKIQKFSEAIESGMLSDSSRLTNEILDDLTAITEAWEERKKLISDFQKLGLV